MLSPAEVSSQWAALRRTRPALPAALRDHQRDSLFNILQGKHVILNVPTGNCVKNSIETPETRAQGRARPWCNSAAPSFLQTVSVLFCFHCTSSTVKSSQ
jgi:hypothetical protein